MNYYVEIQNDLIIGKLETKEELNKEKVAKIIYDQIISFPCDFRRNSQGIIINVTPLNPGHEKRPKTKEEMMQEEIDTLRQLTLLSLDVAATLYEEILELRTQLELQGGSK